jgi:hypothetical protein
VSGRAYEQNPEQVRQWLRVEYPAIAAKARKDDGVILWLDQTGFRSTAAVGTSWAPVGQTPVVAKTGKRFGVNAMIAISNRGELYFTCYTGSFTGPVFLTFCKRLVRHLDRKIHLIVDGPERWRTTAGTDWSYWDLWFCVVCLVDHDGDWDGLDQAIQRTAGMTASSGGATCVISPTGSVRPV